MVAPTDRLEFACQLARALADDPATDAGELLVALGLPGNAHSWPEMQTVLHAHRNGRPVVPSEQRPTRVNMFEPDTDHGSDEFDVAEFSYAEIRISRSARTSFDGTDLHLRILSGCAVRHGDYRSGREGSHIVTFHGHSFILSPDGHTVIGYRRFARQGKGRRPAEQPSESKTRFAVDAFDPDSVRVLPSVAENFSNKHGTDLDEAEEEIRAFLRWALERGKHRTIANGCGVFELRGFRVWVSPDGSTVSKYRTDHIERTPSDVRDGVPSRFGRRRGQTSR